MKNLEDKTVTTTAKQAYEKPTMEVYEIEIEGALLQASAGVQNSIFDQQDDSQW